MKEHNPNAKKSQKTLKTIIPVQKTIKQTKKLFHTTQNVAYVRIIHLSFNKLMESTI